MANVLIDESKMTNIANALRLKTGTTATFTVTQMPSVISNINTTFTPNLRNLEIYPSESSQAFSVASGYDGYGNITVYPLASDYIGTGVARRSASDIAIGGPQVQVPRGYYPSAVTVAFSTTEHPAPTISFNSSTGIITATHSQSTGYTNGGATAANLSLAFQSAITITPGSTSQVISGNQYLGGDITVEAFSISRQTKNVVPQSYATFVTYDESLGYNALGRVTVDAIPSTYISDPYYNIYKSLAFRSLIKASDPYVSEWANSLSSTNYYAFAGQPFLGSFYFNNIVSINDYAFATPMARALYGQSQHNFYFPQAISVGMAAFKHRHNLKYIELPECLYLKSYAFSGAQELSQISIPKVQSMGDSAFAECHLLSFINAPNCTTLENYAFISCTGLSYALFPELLSIPPFCFSDCNSLNIISVPKISLIEYNAFTRCSTLSSINAPLCTSIGNNAFYSCPQLLIVDMPKVENIGVYAFAYCDNLSNISFPTLSTLGSYAFLYCSSLLSVSLPVCSIIYPNAFGYCTNLSNINLPALTNLGGSIFQSCYNLRVVSLGGSFSAIGTYTFRCCYNLLSLYLNVSSIISLTTNAFLSTPISNYTTSTGGVYGTIYVPSSLYNQYRTAAGWSIYSARLASF